MKLPDGLSDDARRRWRVVRLSDCMTLPGIPLAADEDTGDAVMREFHGGAHTDVKYALGSRGLAIVHL